MHHTITFRPSGHVLSCTGARSILSTALESGIELPFSCRSGVCRTCRGRVLEGRVDPGDVHPAYLSPEDMAHGFVHLCQARAIGDCTIEVEELDPALSFPTQQLPMRVLAMVRLAPDVMAVQLGTPANEPVRFHAGQSIEVLLDDGSSRSYSIANQPLPNGVRRVELHIRHLAGGRFTDRVFATLRTGEILHVRAPLGLVRMGPDDARPLILVCSGTGFAPVKAIVESSLASGSTRPLHIYWGGRQHGDLYLDTLARGWAAEHRHISYTPVLSEAAPSCSWTGRIGFVHEAVLVDYANLEGHSVYACGVPAMVEAARRDFTGLRWLPARDFLADSFVSEADRIHLHPTEMTAP